MADTVMTDSLMASLSARMDRLERLMHSTGRRIAILEDTVALFARILTLPYLREVAGEIVDLLCWRERYGNHVSSTLYVVHHQEDYFMRISALFGMPPHGFRAWMDRVVEYGYFSAHTRYVWVLEAKVRHCEEIYRTYPYLKASSEDQFYVIANWRLFQYIITQVGPQYAFQ